MERYLRDICLLSGFRDAKQGKLVAFQYRRLGFVSAFLSISLLFRNMGNSSYATLSKKIANLAHKYWFMFTNSNGCQYEQRWAFCSNPRSNQALVIVHWVRRYRSNLLRILQDFSTKHISGRYGSAVTACQKTSPPRSAGLAQLRQINNALSCKIAWRLYHSCVPWHKPRVFCYIVIEPKFCLTKTRETLLPSSP